MGSLRSVGGFSLLLLGMSAPFSSFDSFLSSMTHFHDRVMQSVGLRLTFCYGSSGQSFPSFPPVSHLLVSRLDNLPLFVTALSTTINVSKSWPHHNSPDRDSPSLRLYVKLALLHTSPLLVTQKSIQSVGTQFYTERLRVYRWCRCKVD